MSRKRKKKKELSAGSAEPGWSTTDLDRTRDKGKGSLRSQIISRRLMLDEPDLPGDAAGRPETNAKSEDEWESSASAHQPEPPRGMLGRLRRWFGGSDQAPAEITPPRPAPEEALYSKPEMPAQETQAGRTVSTARAKGAAPTSNVTGRRGPGVDQVHAVLMLEQVLPELEAMRSQLAEEREAAKIKYAQTEAERDQARAAAEKARVERNEIEVHTNVLRKSVTALERQLQEEREATAKQLDEWEAERVRLRAESEPLEARERKLEGEERAAASPDPQLQAALEEGRAEREKLESLLQNVRAELEEARRQTQQRTGEAEERARSLQAGLEESRALGMKFEARIQALGKQLAAAQEQALHEKQAASSRIQELEAALNEARNQVRMIPESKPAAESEPAKETAAQVAAKASGAPGLSGEAVESLYHQTMARLTVLLACADIVLMNPKLEPRVRQTSEEIKTQGQALLDVIKSFTAPPESQPGH